MKENKPNVKIEYLLDGTTAFNEAFIILNRELNRRVEDANNGAGNSGIILGIPSIVMLSFTIELGFKTLLFKKNNKLVKGHRLDKLFDKIDEHRKSRIKKYTCEKSKKSEDDFAEILENNSSAFVDWRYFFEKSIHVEYNFLSNLNVAILKEMRIDKNNLNADLY